MPGLVVPAPHWGRRTASPLAARLSAFELKPAFWATVKVTEWLRITNWATFSDCWHEQYKLSITVATWVECWLFTQRKTSLHSDQDCILSVFHFLHYKLLPKNNASLRRIFTTGGLWKPNIFVAWKFLERGRGMWGRRPCILYGQKQSDFIKTRLYTNTSKGHHGVCHL